MNNSQTKYSQTKARRD